MLNYRGCKDGRVVADVVRLDRATEGLEPKVTEELAQLMLGQGRQASEAVELIAFCSSACWRRHAHAAPVHARMSIVSSCVVAHRSRNPNSPSRASSVAALTKPVIAAR